MDAGSGAVRGKAADKRLHDRALGAHVVGECVHDGDDARMNAPVSAPVPFVDVGAVRAGIRFQPAFQLPFQFAERGESFARVAGDAAK